MRTTLFLAIALSFGLTAEAQVFACGNVSQPPTLTATLDGSSPALLQLQYGTFAFNTVTVPVVTRNGNAISVTSEDHNTSPQFLPPVDCITQTAVVSNLPPGTYTVDWALIYVYPNSDPIVLHFTTQFTTTQQIAPVSSVPAMSEWMLVALAASLVAAGVLKMRTSIIFG
jgi:methionine-rich copper-binding protein CopC